MAKKKDTSQGFDDFEDNFFAAGDEGDFNWDEDEDPIFGGAKADKGKKSGTKAKTESSKPAPKTGDVFEPSAAAKERAEADARKAEEDALRKRAEEEAALEEQRLAAEEEARVASAEAERLAQERLLAAEEAARVAEAEAEAEARVAEQAAADEAAARLADEAEALQAAASEPDPDATEVDEDALRNRPTLVADVSEEDEPPRIDLSGTTPARVADERPSDTLPPVEPASIGVPVGAGVAAVALGDATPGPTAQSAEPSPPAVPASDDPASVRWRAVYDLLEAEAQTDVGAGKAALLVEASRVARTRLGDLTAAEGASRRAVATGEGGVTALRELSEVLGRLQRWDDLLVVMEDLAAAEPQAEAAAEVLQDAAVLARNHLLRGEDATRLLVSSLERNEDDYFSLQLLVDLFRTQQSWEALPGLLERVATLAGVERAARVHMERARVLELRLERIDDARAAYQAARDADPTFAPSFLALERLAQSAEDWAALAELYRSEAARLADADAVFWLVRASRVQSDRIGDPAAASSTLREAIAAGAGPEVHHALQAMLEAAGDWEGLAAALAEEAERLDGDGAAFARYRLATVQEERLDRPDEALANYLMVAREPAAVPAAEAAARILQKQEDWAGLLDFWRQRLEVLSEPDLRVTLSYRMGEICEGRLDDQEGARTWFEAILDIAPGYLPALEGLERVYNRLEAWDRLAAIYEQRAILAEDDAAVALQLHRAGAVCELRLSDLERARDFYQRALEHVPDFSPSLDALVRLLELAGDWSALAQALHTAAAGTPDANEVVSLYYRAGRVYADKVDDPATAALCLAQCLELSPAFLPARALQKELARDAGDWEQVFALQAGDAASTEDLDRKGWQLVVAAQLAARIENSDAVPVARQALESDPSNAGAVALLENLLIGRGDTVGLVELYRAAAAGADDHASRARLAATLVGLLRDAGDGMGAMQAAGDVVGADSGGRPLLALARVCQGFGYWEVARQALAAAGDTIGVARLQEDHLEAPEEALAQYEAEGEPGEAPSLAVVEAVQRLNQRLGNRQGLAAAHLQLAELSEAPAVRVVHATLAGHLFNALGAVAEARKAYELAFAARPGRGKAFEGLRRLLIASGDSDGLQELHLALPEPDLHVLATDLDSAGDPSGAADVLAGSDEDLATLVLLEEMLEAGGRGAEAFEVLKKRREMLQDAAQRRVADLKLRRLLADHLAGSEEAWDTYRQLHEESPEDAEVLAALGRIAGARGETALAAQYIESLASLATTPEEAATCQRQAAEIYVAADQPEEARKSYLKALDHDSEDRAALDGLRAIAEAAEEHQQLVGVLARLAALTEGAEQVTTYANIARVWDECIGDAAVAADAWRKVLDLDPNQTEALTRLTAITESSGDYNGFVEYGQLLSAHLDGSARTALLGRIGVAYAKRLHREDDALRFLDAATSGEAADLDAARALEKIRVSRGEWDLVVEALRRQAAAQEGEAAVDALLRGARIFRDTLHNREGAARVFEEVRQLDTENEEGLQFLADHAFETQEHARAVELFSSLESFTADWDLDDFDVRVDLSLYFYRFAVSLRMTQKDDEAALRLQRALELNPTHLPSLQAIGPIYMDRQEWKQAEQVYRQLLQLMGGTAQAEQLAVIYSRLGEVERALGKLDKAKKRFNKALDLQPNSIQALQGMAGVLFAEEDWNTLLNVYNNIIYHAQNRADVVDAYITKGFILDQQLGLPEKAAQHYRKGMAFGPGKSAALLRLSELSLRTEAWDEAGDLAAQGLADEGTAPAVKAMLHLSRAVARTAGGDASGAGEDVGRAGEVDVTVADSLSGAAGVEGLYGVLKARLEAGPRL